MLISMLSVWMTILLIKESDEPKGAESLLDLMMSGLGPVVPLFPS